MPKYLIAASYTTEGIRGVLEKGGTNRREAVAAAIAGAGGTQEAFYFAFGGTDVYVLADLPDNTTAAAVCMRVAATGAVGVETTVLLTPEEIDAAAAKPVDYRPPGS